MTSVPSAAPSPLLESLGDGELVEFVAADNRAVMAFTGKLDFCHSGKLVPVDRSQ